MSDVALLSSQAAKTLTRLRNCIKSKGDLPGLAGAVRLIESALEVEDSRNAEISRAVLSDPSLTNKVLRLANSAMYSAFGRQVSTVSRAVALLGTEAIGHLALSQKVLDNLTAVSEGLSTTQANLETAVLSGHVARQIALSAARHDAEAVVICALLRSLGRVLTEYYLTDEWATIAAQARESQVSPEDLSEAVLGISFEAIGKAIAKDWGIPPSILAGMRTVSPEDTREPLDAGEWMAAVSTLSQKCAEVSYDEANTDKEGNLQALAANYAQMLGLPADRVLSAVQSGKDQALAEKQAAGGNSQPAIVHGIPVDMPDIVRKGMADILEAVPALSPGEVLSVTAETLLTGLKLRRAFAFIRKGTTYVPRLAVGPGAQELIKELSFTADNRPDALYQALAGNRVVLVDDTRDSAQRPSLPTWWKLHLNAAKSFLVMPIVANRTPLGFIYGEWDQAYPELQLTPAQLRVLEELRETLLAGLVKRETPLPKAA